MDRFRDLLNYIIDTDMNDLCVVEWYCLHAFDDRDIPEFKSIGASGADIRCWLKAGDKVKVFGYYDKVLTLERDEITIEPGMRVLVPTGYKVRFPLGYDMQLRPRSGNALLMGLTFANCVGSVDSDYEGEVMIEIINLDCIEHTICHGERVGQVVMAKLPRVMHVLGEGERPQESERGEGGFGHTGNH